MAKRRGFFAELQHQAALAEKEKTRQQIAAVKQRNAAEKEAQRAHAAAVRAQEQANRADAKSRAAAEREAKRLHKEEMQAIAAQQTAELVAITEEIDSVLQTTLDVDDHVDLEALTQAEEHPPFKSPSQEPLPAPTPITAPEEPEFSSPPEPTGMRAIFGGKKAHAEAMATALAQHEMDHAAWREQAAALPGLQLAQMQAYQRDEIERQKQLALDQAAYDAQCLERRTAVAEHNAQLQVLIDGLKAGRQDSVEEYVSIVLSRSTYPQGFDVTEEITFDAESGELTLELLLPAPEIFPVIKAVKYVQAQDELRDAPRTAKDQKDRYSLFVDQVLLRTLHEVFESDRGGVVNSISLTAGIEHVSPATGQHTFTPLAAVAVGRDQFEEIDLARVTPAESVKYLNATTSKNPFGLVPADIKPGVQG